MFGTKRLAKRSIVGTRVAGKWQDGRFYPGVIQSLYAEETPFTDPVYTVLFDDGYEKNITSKNIVGPGFQTTSLTCLRNGQLVYLTLNGREVNGTVIKHSTEVEEVLIDVKTSSGDQIEVVKRIDEVRLLKSRKSARLQDQDTDYSKLADLQLSEAKKRTVSSGIDVPSKQIRHWHPEEDDTIEDVEQNQGSGDETMNENIAAMVLTTLSVSPQSPPITDFRYMHTYNKPNQFSSSASSSGFYSNQSERSDPSPPSLGNMGENDPTGSGMFFGPFSQDEGVDFDEEGKENDEGKSNKQIQKKTMYKCTWPSCDKVTASCEAIEKHVRNMHLGVRNEGEWEGEEEFYYTEIEVNVETVTQGFSDMYSAAPSPPFEEQPMCVIPDHDYQKKEFRQMLASSVPSASVIASHTSAMPIPIKVPDFQRSLSWQNSCTFSSSPSPPIRSRPSPQERLQQHQAQSPKLHTTSPPKLMSIHKKPRSEVRKCRKVYGMENRDMWCTQCKWKKACTRFLE